MRSRAVLGVTLVLVACTGAPGASGGADATAEGAAACTSTSPTPTDCPVLVSSIAPACTLALAEQAACALAGNNSPACPSAQSCGEGFTAVNCAYGPDVSGTLFYGPDGSFYGSESFGSGVIGGGYKGRCLPADLNCNGAPVELGCGPPHDAGPADSSAEACVSSLAPCPVFGGAGVPGCTLTQAEQGVCALAEGGSAGVSCSVLTCAGGLGAVTCTDGMIYYYDPSGAFFAESGEGGVVGRLDSGICSFDPAAIACSLAADAGCP